MVTILDTQEDKLNILRRMKEQELDQVVVYSLEECSEDHWLEMLKNSWALTVKKDGVPMGIGWFDNINGRTAQSHFCMFKQHFSEVVEPGLEIIHWLEEKLNVTMLTGITPKPYRQSHQLMGRWGFNKVMEMPQACYMAKYKKHVDGVLYVRKT